MNKIVIVGANHAGTAAANTIMGNYKDAKVTIFDANSNISFLGCGMALWIGEQIAGADPHRLHTVIANLQGSYEVYKHLHDLVTSLPVIEETYINKTRGV